MATHWVRWTCWNPWNFLFALDLSDVVLMMLSEILKYVRTVACSLYFKHKILSCRLLVLLTAKTSATDILTPHFLHILFLKTNRKRTVLHHWWQKWNSSLQEELQSSILHDESFPISWGSAMLSTCLCWDLPISEPFATPNSLHSLVCNTFYSAFKILGFWAYC